MQHSCRIEVTTKWTKKKHYINSKFKNLDHNTRIQISRMLNIHFAILFAIIYLCDGQKIPTPQPPLNQLASIIKYFKSTELCHHICIAKTWFDKTGVYISFTTDRNQGETAGKTFSSSFSINDKNELILCPQMISPIACTII